MRIKGRVLALTLLLVLLALQIQLWVGEGSIGQQRQLKQQIAEQQQNNAELEARNQEIVLEIESLGDDAQGDEGIEERARSELGMVQEGEVFYMMIEEEPEPTE